MTPAQRDLARDYALLVVLGLMLAALLGAWFGAL